MHAKSFTFTRSLALIVVVLLCGCEGSGESPQDPAAVLPLSPGIQIASHVSGGIAGFNDSTQVTNDWQLIVATRSSSFVRRLNGDEQMALREILKRFAVLNHGRSDPPGPDVADAMGFIIVARGWGEGTATEQDAAALSDLLQKLQMKGNPEAR